MLRMSLLARAGVARRRSLVALAVVTALAVPVTAAAPAAAAPEQELADTRARAEQLQREIAEGGRRISILDEEFNQTRILLDEAAADMAAAQAERDDAQRRARELRHRLAGRAAQLYKQAGAEPLPLDLGVDAVTDLAMRSKYGDAAAQEDARLLDDIAVVTEELDITESELERVRADARARQAELDRTRRELEAAQHEQLAVLDEVQDDIAELVAEIEEQKRREEEERVRREIERRRAEEAAREAARRTTPTTAPRSGTPAKTPVPAPAPNARAQTAVEVALAQLGKPYRYAGKGPDVFDCSGLTGYAWAAAGVSIPHSSQAQYAGLPKVSMDEIAPGDLLFYGSPIHHVGVYIGNEQYVHAPQTGDVVKISSIYRSDYAGAARPG